MFCVTAMLISGCWGVYLAKTSPEKLPLAKAIIGAVVITIVCRLLGLP